MLKREPSRPHWRDRWSLEGGLVILSGNARAYFSFEHPEWGLENGGGLLKV